MSKNYLVERLCKQQGVKELTVEEMPLEDLLTAFMDIGKKSEIVLTSTVTRVRPLPIVYAERLKAGKVGVINDLQRGRIYFVKAIEGELIAVFHAMGAWFDIYAAQSTSSKLLVELGINTKTFKDRTIIDGIFEFPMEGPGIPSVQQPELMETPPAKVPTWHAPTNLELTLKDREAMADQAQKDIAQAIEAMMMAAGKLAETGSTINLEEVMETQMAKAFAKHQRQQQPQQPTSQPVVSDTIVVPPKFGEIRRRRPKATA